MMTEQEVLDLINGKKITDLPALNEVSGEEVFPSVKNGITYKTSINTILDNNRLVRNNDPRLAKADNGQTAYDWGNHALAGYSKTDTLYYPGAGIKKVGVTFSADFGQEKDTIAEGNDPRLSNAREWIAPTATQQEITAGISTERRAFSPKLIRDSILAWFSGLSAFTRNILSKTSSVQWRQELGLGSASVKDVGTNPGNLLEVGSFGVGTGISLGANTNLNTIQTPGFYYQASNANTSGALNYPVSLAGSLLVQRTAGVTQQYTVHDSSDVYVRGFYNGSWSTWSKLIATKDILQSTGNNNMLPMSQAAVTNMFSNNKSGNGWCELGGGIILQWGKTSSVGKDTRKTFNFPKPFPNACFSITCAFNNYSNGGAGTQGATVLSASNFRIEHGQDTSGTYTWMAIGY